MSELGAGNEGGKEMISFKLLKEKLDSHFSELSPALLARPKDMQPSHSLPAPSWNVIGRRGDRLATAAYHGDIKEVDWCLQMGVSVDSLQPDGSSPLSLAASRGHSDVVQLLLLHGADFTLENGSGFNSLHWAVVGGNIECVNMILGYSKDEASALSRPTRTGQTVLHLACLNRHQDMAELLLTRHFALKDVKDANGKLPLDLVEEDKYMHCLLSTLQRFPVSVELSDKETLHELEKAYPKAFAFWTRSFSTSCPRKTAFMIALRDFIPHLAVPDLSNDTVSLKEFFRLVQGPLHTVFCPDEKKTVATLKSVTKPPIVRKSARSALLPETARAMRKPTSAIAKRILPLITSSQRVFGDSTAGEISERFASINLMLSDTNSVIFKPRLENAVKVLTRKFDGKRPPKKSHVYISILLEQLVCLCWSSGWIWTNEANMDSFENLISEIEIMLDIDPLLFQDYSDPFESSLEFLSSTRGDSVAYTAGGKLWDPRLAGKLSELQPWSRPHSGFSRPHLIAKCGGNAVIVKQFDAMAPDASAFLYDEVSRLWRVRGSSHVLRFYGITSTRELAPNAYLVFDRPRFTLEEFWRVDPNPAWQIKMKHIRDFVGGVAFIHSVGLAHRNLNPSTIQLDSFNNVKITDFGWACELKDSNMFDDIFATGNVTWAIACNGRRANLDSTKNVPLCVVEFVRGITTRPGKESCVSADEMCMLIFNAHVDFSYYNKNDVQVSVESALPSHAPRDRQPASRPVSLVHTVRTAGATKSDVGGHTLRSSNLRDMSPESGAGNVSGTQSEIGGPGSNKENVSQSQYTPMIRQKTTPAVVSRARENESLKEVNDSRSDVGNGSTVSSSAVTSKLKTSHDSGVDVRKTARHFVDQDEIAPVLLPGRVAITTEKKSSRASLDSRQYSVRHSMPSFSVRAASIDHEIDLRRQWREKQMVPAQRKSWFSRLRRD